MIYQFDRGTFQVIETGEGFLKARISVARPGVFPYFEETGDVSYRAKLPEEIFSKDTLESLKGVPLTKDHPSQNGQYIFVNSENYKQFAKGNVSEPKIVDNEIQAIATIYDADLVAEAKRRHQNNEKQFEASIGFKSLLDKSTGNYAGVNYDTIQRQIIINHVALVDAGRAGENIKLHFDKRSEEMGDKKKVQWTVEGGDTSNLLTYRLYDGSQDIHVDKAILGEIMDIKDDLKARQLEINDKNQEIENLKAKIEKIQVDSKDNPEVKDLMDKLEIANDKSEEWEKKFKELEAKIPTLVNDSTQEKFELVNFAKSVDSSIVVDGLTNREIKLQVIAKGLPFKAGIQTDSITDEQIEARYDAACELLRAKATEPKSGSLQIDSKSIEEKKMALKNLYGKKQGE